jgi:hypothetical protein
MIVPVLFEMYTATQGLWNIWASFFSSFASKNDYPLIIQEQYCRLPSSLPTEAVERWEKIYDYKAINDDDYRKLRLYQIPHSFSELLAKNAGGSINDAFVNIIRDRNSDFEKLIESFINKINNIDKRKISVFLSVNPFPSLNHIAAKHGITVFSLEDGAFRNPLYRHTALMSPVCINRQEHVDNMRERYEKYLHEHKTNGTRLLTKKQILSLMLLPNKLHYLDRLEEIPKYEMGIATGCSGDMRCNWVSFINDAELLFRANTVFGNNQVLTRIHPADTMQFGATYPKLITKQDTSKNSIEFILKCKRIGTLISNVSIEAAFWGKSIYTFVPSGPYFKARHNFEEIDDYVIEDSYLNWYAFSYLTPWEYMTDPDYISWRLSKPTELEVYQKHLNYYIKQDRLPRMVLKMPSESSVSVIKQMRKLFGKKD